MPPSINANSAIILVNIPSLTYIGKGWLLNETYNF
jgi:hypothetical protein